MNLSLFPSRIAPASFFAALTLLVQGTALAQGADTDAQAANPAAPAVVEIERKPDTAHIMGLNKITARTHPMTVKIDESLRFGTLGIIVRACEKARPEDPPKTIGFFEIREYPVNEELTEEPEPIFSGWMLASSPGLNALEHPVYDVWLKDCSISSGPASAASE
ncbi:DUF2155 domain-containing protein [Pyruvatibacter sp.]|uniref:DUF2155 domain-containing protein n=1 Tax=Pyruvatibacter sp. TaxID=1981328 RepID=UPI0032ED40C1